MKAASSKRRRIGPGIALAIVALSGCAKPKASVDSSCEGGVCSDTCTEGASACFGDRAAICQNGQWIERTCEQRCLDGRCVTCSETERRCLNSNTLEECVDGDLVQTLCTQGRCDPATNRCACSPGEYRCNAVGDREVCGDGGVWALEPCGDAQPACHEGACRVCQPDTHSCEDARTSLHCLADGTLRRIECPVECDPGSGHCIEPCDPHTPRCRGRRKTEVCHESGNYYVPLETCTGSEACEEGECVDQCARASDVLAPNGCAFVAPPVYFWTFAEAVFGEPGPAEISAAGRVLLAVVNPDPELTAYVLMRTGESGETGPIAVPPASSTRIYLPAGASRLRNRRDLGSAVRLTSTLPVSVVLYHELSAGPETAFSGDASYLLPEHLLTCAGRRYRVIAHPGTGPVHPQAYSGGFAVVALSTEPTDVDIEFRGNTNGEYSKGDHARIRMQSGDTFHFMAAGGQSGCDSDATCNDLTGTLVESSQPIAVFTAGLSRVPVCISCHNQTQFSEQLIPVEFWKNKHVVMARNIPAGRQPDDEQWVVVSDRDNTELRFTFVPAGGGPPVQAVEVLAAAGDSITFNSAVGRYQGYRAFSLESFEQPAGEPAPVLAARYYHTGVTPAVLKGGSSFEIERPVDFWRSDYWFDAVGGGQNSIQVIIPTGQAFQVDGQTISDPSPFRIDSGSDSYSVYHVPIVNAGARTHHHVSSAARFSLLAYGYSANVSPQNSYGYFGPLGFGDQVPSSTCDP